MEEEKFLSYLLKSRINFDDFYHKQLTKSDESPVRVHLFLRGQMQDFFKPYIESIEKLNGEEKKEQIFETLRVFSSYYSKVKNFKGKVSVEAEKGLEYLENYIKLEARAFLDFEKFSMYLSIEEKERIKGDNPELFSFLLSPIFKWSGKVGNRDKTGETALMELAYSLFITKSITPYSGTLNQDRTLEEFAALFGITFSNPKEILKAAKARNDKTPFLDKLKEAFEQSDSEKK